MITISTLQSQIALNRNILGYLEQSVNEIKQEISNTKEHNRQFPKISGSSCVVLEVLYAELTLGKKNIGKYAKLQRALKSELAYRIRHNRACRGAKMGNYQLK